MKQRYNCLVCNPASEKTLSAALLRIHLKSKHNLYCEEYYYKYELRFDEWPTCARPGCDNKVKFRSLAQGYREYCSKTCRVTHMHMKMSEEDKDILRKRFTEQRRSWSQDERILAITKKAQSEYMANLRRDPVAAGNNAIAVGASLSIRTRVLGKFKKENGGRTPEEDILFKKLSENYECISPDYRYFKSRAKGLIKGKPGGIVLDITIPKYRINIEIDGWTHEKLVTKSDKERDAFLVSQGWCVLRFKTVMVVHSLDLVLSIIEKAVKEISQSAIEIDSSVEATG